MNITLFTPYPLQKEFIKRFADTDDLFGVVKSCRGSGKSLLAMNLILYWLLQAPNRKGGYITPVYSQGKSIMDQIINKAGDTIVASNRMEGTITFMNNSTLKFLSSDSPDSIRGFRFTHLILDEAAFHKESSINTAILPTLNPSGKKCLMISTPAGKNHFHTWFNKDEVVSMSFPLTECPYVSQVLVEEARKSLPPDIFRQEFLAEFVDSSNDVFTNVESVSTVRSYSHRKEDALIGIDTGLTDDFSVLCIISPVGRVLHIETINNRPLQEIATVFKTIMSRYNIIGGNVEANGIGIAMYEAIRDEYNVVRKFITTQESKTLAVRKLIADIESLSIELPTRELCPELHNEFGTFTYKMSNNGKLSFGHSTGAKDDHIDALLLANISRNNFITKRGLSIKGGSTIKVKPQFGSLPR